MSPNSPRRRVNAGRVARRVASILSLLAIGACDVEQLLEVNDIDVATPVSLDDPTALPALRNSVIGDLQSALGAGGENGVITLGGLLADEFVWAETFPTRFEMDVRNINPINGTLDGLFTALQRSRAMAEQVDAAFAKYDARSSQRAEVLAMGGFAHIMIAELFCNGTPLSRLDPLTGVQTFGEPLTNAQVYERAVQKFDSALALLAGVTAPNADQVRTINLARVGKARALVNLDRLSDAAAVVAAVPTSFRYDLIHSENTTRQNNGVYLPTNNFPRYSVGGRELREGGTGLPFRQDGLTDRRVFAPQGSGAAGFPRVGADNSTPMFLQMKYVSRSASVVFADGIEARLIEAEQLLRSGGNYVAVLNRLRTDYPTLRPEDQNTSAILAAFGAPPLAPLAALVAPNTRDAQTDQLFKERAYWMFLTGHRLGDMRRLIRQYGRNSETVFPTGTFHKGGAYGLDVNFPVPFIETNNPEFIGCLDRNA